MQLGRGVLWAGCKLKPLPGPATKDFRPGAPFWGRRPVDPEILRGMLATGDREAIIAVSMHRDRFRADAVSEILAHSVPRATVRESPEQTLIDF